MTARKPKDERLPLGRPSGFQPEFVSQATKLCALGATDAELAAFFEVSARTIYRWISEYPDFCQALKVAKSEADSRVERSLYHRAVGYEHDAVKIMAVAGEVVKVPYTEHVPPDTTAQIFWLKNRDSENWKDRREVSGINGGAIQVEQTRTLKIDVANLPAEDREAFKLAMIEAKARLDVKANESE